MSDPNPQLYPDDKEDEDIHCMPVAGGHVNSKKCWCEPELTEDYRDQGGRRLWVHREIQ